MRIYKRWTLILHLIKKDSNEFKLQYNKQSVEEIFIQRAVKTTIQIHYDKGMFDKFQNADEVFKKIFMTTRRRHDLQKK